MPRDHEDTANPAATLIPTVLIISALGWMLWQLAGGGEREALMMFATLVAGMVYLLTLVNIEIGIATLILCIGLSPEMTVGGITNLRLEDFVVPVLIVAWAARHMARRDEMIPTPLRGPLVLYLGASALALLVASTRPDYNSRYGLLMLGKMCIYALIYLILHNSIRTARQFKAFVILTILVMTLSNIVSVGSLPDPLARVMGPLGETGNIYAGYLAMNLAIVLGLFTTLPSFGGRFLLGAISIFTVHSMMRTYSRTGYIALGVGILTFATLRMRRLFVLALLAAILFPILMPHSVLHRASTIGTILTERPDPSFAARVAEWQYDVTYLFPQSPLFGHGPGFRPLGWLDNDFVRALVDSGLLGLAGLLWLLWRAGRMAFATYDTIRNDAFLKGFAGGYIMALLVAIVHALGATTFTSIRTAEMFFVLTALATALHAHAREWDGQEEEPKEGPDRAEATAGPPALAAAGPHRM
jgi:hypothetical protein